MPFIPGSLLAPKVATDLDTDEGYLPSEALCLVHNLTFHRHLPGCPSCKESL